MSLAEKRRRLLRFHWVEMEIMEILAAWSETARFIPIRAGFGRHLWDQALHCDRIGWALRNLKRLGRVIVGNAPTDEFSRFCEKLFRTQEPALRLVGMYRVLIPALVAAERSYLVASDPLADANSYEALELCLRDHQTQEIWAEQMLSTLLKAPASMRVARELESSLTLDLDCAGGIDSDGVTATFLPYQGWSGDDEQIAAQAEAPAVVGQWHSTGYRYPKDFARGVTRLQWDSRFYYAETPNQLEDKPAERSVDGLVYWLHGLFHGECQTVDRMGWLLVDFPDLPWEMRKDMAQQAWEEARHMQIVAQLIEGLGGQLGQYPFPPYFAHLRRDYHHPVMHMVMGNIVGEGSAAAQTNDALDYTAEWGNDWLRQGLEHLSGDEVVHINFGKVWGRRLSALDRARFWEAGRVHAHDAAAAIVAAQRAFGLDPSLESQIARIDREFTALDRTHDAFDSVASTIQGDY
jgi:uncharacterized ferritin-like protein (DUF455 family)